MFLENRKLRHYIYDLNVHIRIHLSIPFHIRILSATVGKYPLNMTKTWFLNFSVFILKIFAYSKALDVTQYGAVGDGVTDDSQAFLKAWEAVCSGTGDGQLIVPAGMSFMLQPLKFQGSCKSTPIAVQILGTLVASSRGKWKGDKNQWILFSDIEGLVVDGNGKINGQGSSWWEHKGSSRPTGLKFKNCNNLRLRGLTHVDSAMAHIHINGCNDVTISNLRINAPESSPNTDGIDIAASSNVVIQDCVIATGDDCIAINSGTANIRISGIDCGPGHGISIGSLGKDEGVASVEDICVQNCNFRGTMNGARIKTWPGGSGYARRITFNGITLDNVENPIIIDQHYKHGDSDKSTDDKSSAVEVSKVVYSNFVGTSKSEYGVNFRCSERAPCTEIFMKDVKINTASSGMGQVAQGQCLNVRGGVTTLAVPGLECLALSTDWGTLPEQACMLPQQSGQPDTRPSQDPLWVYGSGGKHLGVYSVVLTSLINLFWF
ncbi:probable polygalacturonase At3g15720 isoform X2 [Brassica napus]|uniref:probable polygalacturonase At3g15720 isoform X2 n=1 Tax=Brassica napus TaxID=3708 RepID=UPI00207B0B21|nr:probable polygalacturonase At3g15720 isoform X2 [Brassica napus]